MQENEFILFSSHTLENLKLKIEAVKDFTLIQHSSSSHRIIDNTDKHISYTDNWCFVLNKSWSKYTTTLLNIHTCIGDFINGYDYRLKEEKIIKDKIQYEKDEAEAWKIHKKMKKEIKNGQRKNM